MEGMTKLAMGASIAAALSLAILLSFLLFLLVSLFCSLIRDKQQHHHQQQQHNLRQFQTYDNEAEQQQQQPSRPCTFPFYAHGVLKAPSMKYLLSVPNLEAAAAKPPPSSSSSHSRGTDQLVYVSNPIFDGQTSTDDRFVTSRAPPSFSIEIENENEDENSPPLRLMKKLPAVQPETSSAAVAACLFNDWRSLGASTETNKPSSSSSSSSSLCSSPSW